MTTEPAPESPAEVEPRSRLARWARRTLGIAAGLALLLVWLWTLAALHYLGGGVLSTVLVGAFLLGTPAALYLGRKHAPAFLGISASLALLGYVTTQPSNDREWRPEVARLPRAEFQGDLVTVHDIRANHYRTEDDFDAVYATRRYDLRELQSVDMWLVYWDGNTAIAHTMLSFGFANGDYLCLSVECRRELGEAWGGLPGLYKQFEVIYILGDERDLVNLRTSHRGEDVYLYRLKVSAADARTYLEHVLRGCNQLLEHPRFYGTLNYNCHSSLMRLSERLWPDLERVSGPEALLNGSADRELYARGRLVSGDLAFDELREAASVTSLGRELRDDPEFSRKIRARLP